MSLAPFRESWNPSKDHRRKVTTRKHQRAFGSVIGRATSPPQHFPERNASALATGRQRTISLALVFLALHLNGREPQRDPAPSVVPRSNRQVCNLCIKISSRIPRKNRPRRGVKPAASLGGYFQIGARGPLATSAPASVAALPHPSLSGRGRLKRTQAHLV